VVVSITDGDTLTVLTPDKEQVKIRLAEIDTPERGLQFGAWAKEQLSGMAFQQEIAVLVVGIDSYDHVVGRVFIKDLDINAELVRIGAAWIYDQYATDPHMYELQNEAANASRGLWSQPQTIHPWVWRKLNQITLPLNCHANQLQLVSRLFCRPALFENVSLFRTRATLSAI